MSDYVGDLRTVQNYKMSWLVLLVSCSGVIILWCCGRLVNMSSPW